MMYYKNKHEYIVLYLLFIIEKMIVVHSIGKKINLYILKKGIEL